MLSLSETIHGDWLALSLKGEPYSTLQMVLAVFLNTSLKKGISSIQLSKYLEITQKSAWFMLQRIRHGLEVSGNAGLLANVVEADETYIGWAKKSNKHAQQTLS